MTICVVVADSSKARILATDSWRNPLVEERDFVHPESRLKEQDLVSDGSGSEIDSGAHLKQAENFAHEICDEIDKFRQNNSLRKIYLVASPKFLGLLRSKMSKQCTELLVGEINKDLVNHSIEDIRSHLPRRL